jgi:hypothetical protein
MRETIQILVTMPETVAAAYHRTPGTHWDADDLNKGVQIMFAQGIAAELGRGDDTMGILVQVTMPPTGAEVRCDLSQVGMAFQDAVSRACQTVRGLYGAK